MKNTDFPSPFLTVDVVLLTLLEDRLHVALVRRENKDEPFFGSWSLPGGFVRPQEDIDAEHTARRVLRDKASVQSPYLEQLVTMAGSGRDPRGWSASIAYYALVPAQVAPENDDRFKWEPVDEVIKRTLPFDHSAILQTAIERVRSKSSYSALPVHLLPQEFTVADLRSVYEQILGGPLDRRGFDRRLLELDMLEETGEVRAERHRPAKIYRVKRRQELAQLGSGITTK